LSNQASRELTHQSRGARLVTKADRYASEESCLAGGVVPKEQTPLEWASGFGTKRHIQVTELSNARKLNAINVHVKKYLPERELQLERNYRDNDPRLSSGVVLTNAATISDETLPKRESPSLGSQAAPRTQMTSTPVFQISGNWVAETLPASHASFFNE